MTREATPAQEGAKPNEVCRAVGIQVMDILNEATGSMIAAKGGELSDGSYEFILGPVYASADGVSMASPKARNLLVNLRPETQGRELAAVPIKWLCRRGDEYAEVPVPPDGAIVLESIEAPPGRAVVEVRYHLSAR